MVSFGHIIIQCLETSGVRLVAGGIGRDAPATQGVVPAPETTGKVMALCVEPPGVQGKHVKPENFNKPILR